MLPTLAAGLIMSSTATTIDTTRLDADTVASIDRYVVAEMERQRIPGVALGIYKDGSIILAKGYGMANIELNVPMTADTVLQSGSVGKSFTATAIMMLVEEGKIGLEDSISKYFAEAPPSWKPITVANLLSHTSGLAAYDTPELQKPGGPFDIRQDYSEDELVAAIAQLPIDFQAGENWVYENTNFVLLGILIHRVTGKPYGEFLAQRIFSPLGMVSSRIISDIDIVPNRSSGYVFVGGVLQNQQSVSPTFNSTADGTMYFTLRDIERWDRALYGESLLKAQSLQEMWTPYPYGGKYPAEGYGFGWRIEDVNGRPVVGHGGAWQGFTTHILRYLDDQLTVVALTNLDSSHSDPGAIVRAVAGITEPALEARPRPAITDDRAELSAKAWSTFQAIIKGEDKRAGLTPDVLSALDVEDLRQSLPEGWSENAPLLIEREAKRNDTLSTYKIGREQNKRLLEVLHSPDRDILSFGISPDPDNR